MKIIDYRIYLLLIVLCFFISACIGISCNRRDLERAVIRGEVVIPGEGAFICERYRFGWELNEREKHEKNGRAESKD